MHDKLMLVLKRIPDVIRVSRISSCLFALHMGKQCGQYSN